MALFEIRGVYRVHTVFTIRYTMPYTPCAIFRAPNSRVLPHFRRKTIEENHTPPRPCVTADRRLRVFFIFKVTLLMLLYVSFRLYLAAAASRCAVPRRMPHLLMALAFRAEQVPLFFGASPALLWFGPN